MTAAHTVYLCRDDTYDLSRWLEFRLESTGDVSLTISDRVYPAGVRFCCPIRHLQVVGEGLSYHVSERGNYCAFRVRDDYVEIEYATHNDDNPSNCSIKLEDFREALRHLYPSVSRPGTPTLF
jgi:hypothetical protein